MWNYILHFMFRTSFLSFSVMFKIDNPENFDVTLRVRRRQKGESAETSVQCPCQDKSVTIKLGEHLNKTTSKSGKQTGHAK